VEDDLSCVDDDLSVEEIAFDSLRGGMHVSEIPFGGEQAAIGACFSAFRGAESTKQGAR
jgi:hypothetical protein